MSAGPLLRPGRDEDAAGFIALVAGCWAEYPGCVMDLDGECPELRALATYAAGKGGALWAAEDGGRIVGMIIAKPHAAEAWELSKLYVAAPYRGSGLAAELAETAEGYARGHGGRRMVLWSDTRFERAHRFYEKRSYVRCGPLRALGDKSNSIEFAYAKPLMGVAVARLDAAGVASAGRRLVEILLACAAEGVPLCCPLPLTSEEARRLWQGVAAAVVGGRSLLLAGWREGELAGVVEVATATAANQRHRGEIRNLMVLPGARRRGLGRGLMLAAEGAAAAAGCRLLTLQTASTAAAGGLYRSLGWQEAGRVPGYLLAADGTATDVAWLWKNLPIKT
jgi:GNAT superfamily N-acetyltransferase